MLPGCNFKTIDNSEYKSRSFETSLDLKIRRRIGYWNKAQAARWAPEGAGRMMLSKPSLNSLHHRNYTGCGDFAFCGVLCLCLISFGCIMFWCCPSVCLFVREGRLLGIFFWERKGHVAWSPACWCIVTVCWVSSVWRNYDLAKLVKFGLFIQFLEIEWEACPAIWHADAHWLPSDVIGFKSRPLILVQFWLNETRQ